MADCSKSSSSKPWSMLPNRISFFLISQFKGTLIQKNALKWEVTHRNVNICEMLKRTWKKWKNISSRLLYVHKKWGISEPPIQPFLYHLWYLLSLYKYVWHSVDFAKFYHRSYMDLVLSPFGKRGKLLWQSIFVVVLWGIQGARNSRLLHNRSHTLCGTINLISIKVAHWVTTVETFGCSLIDSIVLGLFTVQKAL